MTLVSPSIERHAHGYLLTKAMIHWFQQHYMHADDDKRACSPLYWPDLRGAAPAIVVIAGYDPLVDEGAEYADRLTAAGVDVRLRRHPELVHGFLSCAGAIRAARTAVDELCRSTSSMPSPAGRMHGRRELAPRRAGDTLIEMIAVVVALADVGPGVQFEEGLKKAGFAAHWDAKLASGAVDSSSPTVVLLDVRTCSARSCWRSPRRGARGRRCRAWSRSA